MERQEVVERLAVHAALGLHIVAKWMSEHDTVPRALKERLATHLMGIDSSSTGDSLAPIGWVLIVVGYLALAMVQTYFLAALVAGADMRLRGNDSTVRAGLDIANSRSDAPKLEKQ